MEQNKFPKGWTEERVRTLIASYEEQTEDAPVAEDEAGVQSAELIAKRQR